MALAEEKRMADAQEAMVTHLESLLEESKKQTEHTRLCLEHLKSIGRKIPSMRSLTHLFTLVGFLAQRSLPGDATEEQRMEVVRKWLIDMENVIEDVVHK